MTNDFFFVFFFTSHRITSPSASLPPLTFLHPRMTICSDGGGDGQRLTDHLRRRKNYGWKWNHHHRQQQVHCSNRYWKWDSSSSSSWWKRTSLSVMIFFFICLATTMSQQQQQMQLIIRQQSNKGQRGSFKFAPCSPKALAESGQQKKCFWNQK